MFQIIDDVLSDSDFKNLQDVVFSSAVDWHLTTQIVPPETNNVDDIQFVHHVYNSFEHYASPMLNNLGHLAVELDVRVNLRIKINITTKSVAPYNSGFHIDIGGLDDVPFKTAVFYLNDNNGYTEFENGERVYSKANRAVIFDGKTRHAGVSCTDQKFRCVLNWNFI
jgi:hypothetical protein